MNYSHVQTKLNYKDVPRAVHNLKLAHIRDPHVAHPWFFRHVIGRSSMAYTLHMA